MYTGLSSSLTFYSRIDIQLGIQNLLINWYQGQVVQSTLYTLMTLENLRFFSIWRVLWKSLCISGISKFWTVTLCLDRYWQPKDAIWRCQSPIYLFFQSKTQLGLYNFSNGLTTALPSSSCGSKSSGYACNLLCSWNQFTGTHTDLSDW